MGIAKILNIFSVKKQTVYKTSQIDKKNIPLLIMYNSLQIFCHLLPIAFLVIHVKVIGVFPAIHSLTGAMCKCAPMACNIPCFPCMLMFAYINFSVLSSITMLMFLL